MKSIKFFKRNKYFTRIFIWITCITLLIISSFSALIYFNVENKVLNREYENSQKVLLQMKYNIDYLDSMIRNLTLSTYSNNDVKALMYLNESETFENLKILNNLNNTLVANNPFIQSIYIYNNHKHVYYSTSDGIFHNDHQLEQILKTYTNIPLLKAIVRNTEVNNTSTGKKYDTVLSYIMCENVDSENNMDGAVILNIKLDWLLNNIKAINQLNDSVHSQLYVLDSNGQFIEADPTKTITDTSLGASLKAAYEQLVMNQQSTAKETPGFFTESINHEKYLISYIHLSNTGWTLLEGKPYNEVYASLKQLLDTILLITLIILIVALLLSMSVSRGIYSPVKRLVEVTALMDDEEDEGSRLSPRTHDEFSYLTEVYQKSKERIKQYHVEKKKNIGIMKLYFLRKLLFNSNSLNSNEFDDLLRELNVSLVKEKPILICILRIDDYKRFLNSKNMDERELLRFAIMNITTECISKSFVVQMVDMKDDSFTILMNVDVIDEDEKKLEQYLHEAQSCLQRFYKLSVSTALSKRITDYTEITAEFNNTMSNSDYRYMYGKGSIISKALISDLTDSRVEIEQVLELENKFFDTVRRGDFGKATERLEDLFLKIKKLTYSDVMYVNMHIVHRFKKVIYESNQTRKEPISVHNTLRYKEFYEVETLDEFKERLLGILQSIADEGKEAAAKGNTVEADTIRDIIETNYSDTSLGASSISDMLKLSSYKLSKIVKEHFGMTIPEYINHVRLNKAVEWMENSQLSIQEIMVKVGIENESYFYKLFKSKFGTTPRDYKAQKDRI
ncbi:AraC family transcriptional regulator [Paenibacillus sp. GCM10027628]|uniref:AraC family transcriptional regulator n=1 Tax=Paenibacillus sp. GCM10027628 TaxID=3273413 RepID=UPI00362A781E